MLDVLNRAIFFDGLRCGGGLVGHSVIPVKRSNRRLRSLPPPMSECIVTSRLLVVILSQSRTHLGALSLHVYFLVTLQGHVGLEQA